MPVVATLSGSKTTPDSTAIASGATTGAPGALDAIDDGSTRRLGGGAAGMTGTYGLTYCINSRGVGISVASKGTAMSTARMAVWTRNERGTVYHLLFARAR